MWNVHKSLRGSQHRAYKMLSTGNVTMSPPVSRWLQSCDAVWPSPVTIGTGQVIVWAQSILGALQFVYWFGIGLMVWDLFAGKASLEYLD